MHHIRRVRLVLVCLLLFQRMSCFTLQWSHRRRFVVSSLSGTLSERIQTHHGAGKHPQLMMLMMHSHTHTEAYAHTLFSFFPLYIFISGKKKKNPQSLTEYFGTVVTTEILNWNNCHTRCCEFISQHKEKWFLASIFTWQDAHCIWTNILHFNYFFVPWNDRNNVSASVKVLSNRAHFSLTKKHGLCKYKTKEREREGVDSCLMENIQRTDIQFHGVEIGALTRFLFHC